MSVVVYIESQKGVVKKAGLEIASFGRAIADASQNSLVAVTFNLEDTSTLKLYGVDKVYNIDTEIGEKYDLTKERIRQIKERAIKRLQKTRYSNALKVYLG